MWKKIVAGLLVLVVIVVAAFKIFFNSENVEDLATKLNDELEEYYLKGTMELTNGEEVRNFNVEVGYEKEEDTDNFRVSLVDTNINQEQLILRNNKGVFILTPTLNQVYEFKGDWPLNTPKPYIYQSMLNAFKITHELEKLDDGYLVTCFPEFSNKNQWYKEEIKFDKELKPLLVNIYDKDDILRVKLVVTEFKKDTDFSDDYFDVDKNLEESKTTSMDVTSKLEDLPLYPSNVDLNASLKDSTVANIDGQEIHILTYGGEKPFTVVQRLLSQNEEVVSSTIEGEMIDLMNGVGFICDGTVICIYNGVEYKIYSDTLTVAELIEVANGMEVVVTK